MTSPGQPGLIWIVDGKTQSLVHTITSDGIWSAGAAYDAKANRLYVGQGGFNQVLVIDPGTGTVLQRLSSGETPQPQKDEPANFFINVVLDAEGRRLFAAGGQKDQVSVWDLAAVQVVQRIPFKSGALDIACNPVREQPGAFAERTDLVRDGEGTARRPASGLAQGCARQRGSPRSGPASVLNRAAPDQVSAPILSRL